MFKMYFIFVYLHFFIFSIINMPYFTIKANRFQIKNRSSGLGFYCLECLKWQKDMACDLPQSVRETSGPERNFKEQLTDEP